MKYLEYKGYTGSIEYSPKDKLLYGKVLGIRGLISYEGDTDKSLEADFKEAINTYLADCKAEGKTPEKEFLLIGGMNLLSKSNSLKFIKYCSGNRVRLLGVDAFFVSENTIQPFQEESIDLSNKNYSNQEMYSKAIQTIQSSVKSNYFEIIY